MQKFILLTRLIREEVHPSFTIEKAEKTVVAKVQELLPDVKWISNYAILGPWDYVDVFQAPDMMTAMKLSTLVRYYGGAYTEIWPATDWNCFEKAAQELAGMIEK